VAAGQAYNQDGRARKTRKAPALTADCAVALAVLIAVVATTAEPASTPAAAPPAEPSEEEGGIALPGGESSEVPLTPEQERVSEVALRVDELPEGWSVSSRTWGLRCACMEDLACRTTQMAVSFQNKEEAGGEDKLELSNTVYLCWDERVAEACVSGDLAEAVEGITIVEVDVGDKAYCEFHYDGEGGSLEEANLLFRRGQFYARFRYWGTPLRDMGEAEVLAFLLPLAENVCGRMT